MAVGALLGGCFAGCGSGSNSDGDQAQNRNHSRIQARAAAKRRAHARALARQRARELRQQKRERRQRQRERRKARQAALAAGCPSASQTLSGVYHPDRLSVIDPCRRATGSVTQTAVEEDGDLHFDVALDSRYRSMLLSGNRSEQDGDLVVELMPRDYGHIDAPQVGDRVQILGAYVNDTMHGWAELHPVWSLVINGSPAGSSGPQYGGSPPSSLSDNALATCHIETGARCRGYNGAIAPPPEEEGGEPGGGGGGGSGSAGCDSGYSGCVPSYPPDVDCDQINGPVKVYGSDPHGLDSDGDGVGCES